MDVKSFLIAFENRLIANGYTREDARFNTLKIAKSLKDADKARIHTITDASVVHRLADNYIQRVSNRTKDPAAPQRENQIVKTAPNRSSAGQAGSRVDGAAADTDSKKKELKPSTEAVEEKTDNENTDRREPTQKISALNKKSKVDKVKLTPEGRSAYRKWKYTSGLSSEASSLFASIGSFFVYVLISILITVLVTVLVCVTVVGCIAMLAGLIYGIIKLFSVVPEGIYELGLALVIMSVTLAGSIGLYNLAVRITPILWKKFSSYRKDVRRRRRIYLNSVRTECNGQ